MHRGYYDQPPMTPTPRRPKLSPLMIILGIIFSVAIAACVFLLLFQLSPSSSSSHPSSSESSIPAISTEDEIEDSQEDGTEFSEETSISRAPIGDGTTLTLHSSVGLDTLSYQDIYNQTIQSIVSVNGVLGDVVSAGTGVIFTSDGYIVTNAHVITGASSVEIILYDNRIYSAQLVGMDSYSDLAVLKIDGTNFSYTQFGDSNELVVGDTALAIGNPLGYDLIGSMTEGIISGLNRDVTMEDSTMSYIQTSCAINSGNSGGALLNEQGLVVGITTLKMMSTSDTIEGLGFAIPSTTVKEIVDELIANGEIPATPTIGITVNTAIYTLDDKTGLMIIEVDPLSDAATQGLMAGDIIVDANGISIDSYETLLAIKDTLAIGDTMTCTIARGGTYLSITFALMDPADLS